MGPYEEFKELSETITEVNQALGPALEGRADRKPIDRVNDIALIVFIAFAFEALCCDYVGRGKPAVLRRLEQKAAKQGKLHEIQSDLQIVRPIIMIRNLWAHGAGRRSGLLRPKDLPPEVLERHHFETDDDPDDADARWWPTRDKSFIACVGPLMELAKKVANHITP